MGGACLRIEALELPNSSEVFLDSDKMNNFTLNQDYLNLGANDL